MITIFTDASHCDKLFVSGWGSWYKGDGWSSGRTAGGWFQGTKSVGEAELTAILYATSHISDKGYLLNQESVIIQSDSLSALGALMSPLGVGAMYSRSQSARDSDVCPRFEKSITEKERKVLADLREILERRFVYVRHIKGHQSSASSRSWVNEKCDSLARQNLHTGRNFVRRNSGLLEQRSLER